MASEEGRISERMALVPIGTQVKSGLVRVEALRDVLSVACAPILWVVVQHSDMHMHLLSGINFELFRGTLGQDGVLRDENIRRKVDRSLNPERLLETVHRILEVLLDVLIFTRLPQLVVVNLVALGVPRLKGEQRVDFFQKLLLHGEVAVHVDVLHHIVDADLGRGHSRHVDRDHVSEHRLLNRVCIAESAISFTTLMKKD